MLPTFAAAAGTKLPENAVIDGVNQLPVLTGKSKDSKRELLVISPNSPKHLTIRKGDWVYIPEQDEGGFQGKDIGNHLLAGAAAQKLTKLVNSDIQDGKVNEDAPPAQLYDLKTDPYQTTNLHSDRPEVVAELSPLLEKWRKAIPASPRLGWINLRQGGTHTSQKGKDQIQPGSQDSRKAEYTERFPGLRDGQARTVENHQGEIRAPNRKPDAFFSRKTQLQQAG